MAVSSPPTLRPKLDLPFINIFGRGRGGHDHTHPIESLLSAPLAQSLALRDILLGNTPLALGLTLLVGEAGSGKTAAATFLASNLAAKGQEVAYLETGPWRAARPANHLLKAQLSALAPTDELSAWEHIAFSDMGETTVIANAGKTVSEGKAEVVIIDSLLKPLVWPSLRTLSFSARSHEISVLATCSPEFLLSMEEAGNPLSSMKAASLHTHNCGVIGNSDPLFAVGYDDETLSAWFTVNEDSERTRLV